MAPAKGELTGTWPKDFSVDNNVPMDLISTGIADARFCRSRKRRSLMTRCMTWCERRDKLAVWLASSSMNGPLVLLPTSWRRRGNRGAESARWETELSGGRCIKFVGGSHSSRAFVLSPSITHIRRVAGAYGRCYVYKLACVVFHSWWSVLASLIDRMGLFCFSSEQFLCYH